MCTSGDVACMIAEPIQGVGGFATPPDGFFGAMQKVLVDYGILFIADEVQTGFGRTGDNFWGYQAHGIIPDLITVAKGIGNGLTLGGVIGRADVLDSIPANSISTFGGNPLSCAGALANLDYLLAHDLQGNARKQGEVLANALRGLGDRHPFIADVRGRGLDARDRAAACPAATRAVAARSRGRPVRPRSWRRRKRAACSSARAASTATCCASRRR